MATAFQDNAFQTTAFQIDSTPVVEVDDTHDGMEEAKRFSKRKEDLRGMITFAYDKEYGLLPVAQEVREIVEPFAKGSEIDWESISEKAVERLLVLQEALERELDDEETMMVLH